MPYIKADLENQLKDLALEKTDSVLFHSSMKAIGHVDGGADTVLDVLISYFSDGLLIFPTHTWAKVNQSNPFYNVSSDQSCVGILTNLFLMREGVVRSWHPTHSVAALGKNAADYIQADRKGNTPCSREGCWGKLYDLDAKIVFLGCSMKRNTIIHGVEEWCNIPNRLSKEMTPFQVQVESGEIIDKPCYTHHSPVPDISENYDIIEEALLYTGAASEGKFGDARIIICKVRPMVDLVSGFLKKEPNLFLSNKPVPFEWYSAIKS